MQQQQNHPSTRHHGRVLFISDLHLCESRPEITQSFLNFLSVEAPKAEALYVLGDLFEYWAGDDDLATAFHQTILNAFARLAEQHVKLFLMHGNRDFLIADGFCQAAKITLLNDPTLIYLGEQATLLSHGDALCTDDQAYQTMRVQFREPAWQKSFLTQPLAKRKAQIANIRMQSEAAKANKSVEIMDVNTNAVNGLLQQFEYPPIFIHGHTHRPNTHSIQHNGHHTTRHVLGDWYEQGSYLLFDQGSLQAIKLPIND
jgi:UDP-2,3-diacylglucosamine hydrolase